MFCETWKNPSQITRRLQTFINKCLRRIMNIKWTDKITNEELWRITKQKSIKIQIKRRKWRWIGPTLRKDLYIILYYIILYYVVLYCIILCYVMLCYVVVLCYFILYYIILYYIILYYIILYYIIFYIILTPVHSGPKPCHPLI